MIIKALYTSRLRTRFPHLRCVFLVLTLIQPINKRNYSVNACVNVMCQFGLKLLRSKIVDYLESVTLLKAYVIQKARRLELMSQFYLSTLIVEADDAELRLKVRSS